MGDLSEHFSRSEFRCKGSDGCHGDVVDAELLTILEAVRAHFDVPVIVTSGYRCISHNKAVGGGIFSQHLRGMAADIILKEFTAFAVHRFLDEKYPTQYGLGSYSEWTHIDSRKIRARWKG